MKILSFLRNHGFFLAVIIGVLANLGVLVWQDKKIKSLETKNENLASELESKEAQIDELNAVIINNQNAIDELSANAVEKENLSNELKQIRNQILKDLKQNDEIINKPLRDSVDFVITRLREQKAD